MADGFKRDYSILERFVNIEAFLIQVVVYLALWVWHDYLATILSMIIGGIAFSIYVIAKVIEVIDRSRVPKVFYRLLVICFMAPALAAIIGLLLKNGVTWQ